MNKFKKIFEYFINNSDNSVFFINTKDQTPYIEFIKNNNSNYYLHDALIPETMLPYNPFLSYLKTFLRNKEETEITEILDKSKVYYFQREVFKTFFQNKPTVRIEEINSEEINYEKNEMYSSIKNLLNYILGNKKIVILIKNSNFLEESSMNLIKWIIEQDMRKNFIIILSFEDGIINRDEESAALWETLLEKGEEKSLIYNAEDIYCENRRDNSKKITKELSGTRNDKLNYGLDCYNFLAYEESKKVIVELNSEIDNKMLTGEEALLVNRLAGDTFFVLRESDKALSYYNSMAEYGADNNNKEALSEAYRKMAAVHAQKQNFDMSEKFSEQSLKISIETGNHIVILRSYYMVFLVKSIISTNELNKIKSIFEKIVELSEELKMYNTLSRCYGIVVSEYEFYRSNEVRLKICLKAIKITFKYGNKNRTASLYHNLGIIYMGIGNKEKSFEYYKKSEKLKIKLGIKNEIARIYNGIGYDLLLAGKFNSAIVNFEKALDCLTDEREYGEILLTFYNISVLFFLIGKYDKVIEYLQNIINIIKILNMKKIHFHSSASIYSIMAVAAIKQGKYMKSIEYYNNAKSEKELSSEEEKIYMYLMNGLILNEEKNYCAALEEFKKIDELKFKVQSKILIAKFYFEYEIFLRENNKIEDSKIINKIGETFCSENNLSDYKSIFKEYLEKSGEKIIKSKNFNIKSIVEFAKQEININTIHKKRNEEKFLIKVHQIFLNKHNNIEKMIENIVTLVKNNFIVEECAVFLNKKDKYNFKLSEDIKAIESFTEKLQNRGKSILLSGDKLKNEVEEFGIKYSSILNIPIKSGEKNIGTIFFATKNPELILCEEDERILSIMTQQLAMIFINLELTESLENKNRKLSVALEKMKSMENMISIIHTEKDIQKGIDYILKILVTENSFSCNKAFYLNYDNLEKALFVAGSSENRSEIKEALKSIKIKIEDKNDISKVFKQGELKEGYSESGIISYLFGIKRFVIFPVNYQERKYGILLVEIEIEREEEMNVENDMLAIAAANLGVYLENKKFHSEIIRSEKLKTVVEFSKAIVHELRTPLSGIKGFAKIEKRRHEDDEKTKRHMDEIINGAERIDEMSGELLYYVSEDGLNFESTFIKKAINSVLKELKNHIEAEKIEINIDICDDISIKFEVNQLKKILKEILKNCIEASTNDKPGIWISAEKYPDNVELIIKDNGIGIDKEELKLIEQPLNSSKIQGKGMGITIVNNILKKHNGKMEINSLKGEWTEVKIIFYEKESGNEHCVI